MKKKYYCGICALIIVLLLTLSSLPVYADETSAPSMNGENWMSFLPNDVSIGSVNLPGTHDSGCTYFNSFDYIPGFVEEMAHTQNLFITDQLKAGFRVFDLRYSRASGAAHLLVNHGGIICQKSYGGLNLTLDNVIEYMRDFLKANPTESVVLYFAKEYAVMPGLTDVESDKFKEMEDEFFDKLRSSDDVIYVKNGEEFPTVGEARGKIVTYANGGLQSTHMYYEKISYDTKWTELSKVLNDSKAIDYNWKPHLSNKSTDPDRPRHIGTNCYGDNYIPKDQAIPLNTDCIMPYDFKKGTYYGWITMDFGTAELASKIYNANYFNTDAEGKGVKYISDLKFSYAQNIETAKEYLKNKGYTVLENNFNDEGADKPYSSAFVNGKKNKGSFNIAVGYKTSYRPENAITGMIWQYIPPKSEQNSDYEDYKKRTCEIINKYHYECITLCDTYQNPNGFNPETAPQSALDVDSLNIGTDGYTVNLMITHDPAAGNALVDLKDLKTYLKTKPGSVEEKAANSTREEYFKDKYRTPRDVDNLMFGSNYGRDEQNDIMLFYRQAASKYFDFEESNDAAFLPAKVATIFGPKTLVATISAAIVLLAVITILAIRKRRKGNIENA